MVANKEKQLIWLFYLMSLNSDSNTTPIYSLLQVSQEFHQHGFNITNTIHEVNQKISSLLPHADTSEIQTHLRNIKRVIVSVEHTDNPENNFLRDWLAVVKDLINNLMNDMTALEELLRSPRSLTARWMKMLTRSDDFTQDQILSKITDATRKLNELAETYRGVTKIVGEANNKETGSTNPYEGYSELSDHQKPGLAYCSLFPKGYEFDVPGLICLWTAEGLLSFTDPDSKGSPAEPEDWGKKFVSEFVEKKIFQDEDKDEIGRTRSCKLNPQMHDLAALIARDGIMSMDPEEEKVPEGLRRVSFDYSLDISYEIPLSLFKKAKKLSTILLSAVIRSRLPNEVKMKNTTCQKVFSSFKDLCVLDLHNLGIRSVPASIDGLKYLQYLDLSENHFKQLPSSITKLANLQTLKLSRCLVLKELPRDLKELKGLKHLELEGCFTLTHMPTGMEKMTSLRTLSNFVVSDGRTGATLKELTGLIKLTGDLEIVRLEQLKLEAPDKDCLQQNKSLYGLTLRWDHDNDYKNKLSDSDKKDKIPLQLENLRPHDELKILFIVGYLGKQLQNWLSSLNNIVKFSLYNCPSCDNIPPLHTLPSLKILLLQRLDSLQYIDCTEPTDPDFSNGFFESLEKLSLWDCPKLTSWWKAAHIKATFPRISELEVRYCPELTRMPLFPRLDKKLVLVSSAGEPLRTTIEDGTSSTSPPLSHLKSVLIANIEIESPEAWIGNFTSLEEFHIRDCPLLESLPWKHFNNLKSLVVENCAELNLPDEAAWKGLESLRSLAVRGIPKLHSLLPDFGELTSLEDLKLYGCHELTSLSNGIGKLTSLSKLVLSECKKLASLPTEIKEVESLDTLIIKDCPLLLPRCQRDTGDDWPNISHIKKIILK